MGDSPYHFGVWDALRCAHENLHPSIAILHDRFYLHLFHDHAVASGREETFRELLSMHYDTVQAERAIRLLEQGAPLDALEPFALCEPSSKQRRLHGHSRFFRDRAGLAESRNVLDVIPRNTNAAYVKRRDRRSRP